ncbi:protein PROTON GRADIENT REGULATION 5, chloroplastic-like [Dioscorea cayenensis subsp. rotundata]|uniref:Protein PROTON GRADIENT REGULATION 5, chloroplastic-like n=1 Tax=Dioscorea cayennensis subsp. rotundata TaxID=55577 RepID=A0AB40C9V9_DIOCR|nr:protein PROTON GRADIENT REGULATION 5, chloroplastic-like [Dioscorea cayenensis subsp. rotundata]
MFFMAMAMSTALPSTTFLAGDDRALLIKPINPCIRVAKPLRPCTIMGSSKQGVFSPLVILARNVLGRKRFNLLRGKAIALHSQVITEFCKSIGADNKQRQGLIRLAKKNGERLGFLA